MPRQRLNVEQAWERVSQFLPANGQRVLASDVRSALESSGNGDLIEHFPKFKRDGKMRGIVVRNDDGTTSHYYQVGE